MIHKRVLATFARLETKSGISKHWHCVLANAALVAD
jgi:hypothetical protein